MAAFLTSPYDELPSSQEFGGLGPADRLVPPQILSRLLGSRRDLLQAAIKKTRTVWVVVSLCGAAPEEAPRMIGEARAYADSLGWGIRTVITDACLASVPLNERACWRTIQGRIRPGFADGLVTSSRSTIVRNDEEYAAALAWMERYSAFIAYTQHPYGAAA